MVDPFVCSVRPCGELLAVIAVVRDVANGAVAEFGDGAMN